MAVAPSSPRPPVHLRGLPQLVNAEGLDSSKPLWPLTKGFVGGMSDPQDRSGSIVVHRGRQEFVCHLVAGEIHCRNRCSVYG